MAALVVDGDGVLRSFQAEHLEASEELVRCVFDFCGGGLM